MNDTRDLGFTLVAAAVLLFGIGYLTQCSPATRRTEPAVEAAPTGSKEKGPVVEEERRERGGPHESAERPGDEQEEEERAKIRKVAHALQTIAASPELRATVGLPQ